MNSNNQPIARAKGNSTLVRAKFGPGMLLQHEDLEQLNAYTRDLSRLMFSSLFGCGVVCGLVVGTETKCGKVVVTVGSGLALDCQGDPIYVPQPPSVVLDDKCDPNIPNRLWVVLCGTQKCCAPRTAECSSDDDDAGSVCTRERMGYEIRIMRSRPQCACSCQEPEDSPNSTVPPMAVADDDCWCVNPEHPCYRDHYAGKCGCDCEDCANCDCDCVLLARLQLSTQDNGETGWVADHRVRRFIRPMLMRDPQVHLENQARQSQQQLLAKRNPEAKDAADAVKSSRKAFTKRR